MLRNLLGREKRYCEALAREIWPTASSVHVHVERGELVLVEVDGVPELYVPPRKGATRALGLALLALLEPMREREEAARRRLEAKAREVRHE